MKFPSYDQKRVFEAVGLSQLDAAIDAYIGYPQIQADILRYGLAAPVEQAADHLAAYNQSTTPLSYDEDFSRILGCEVFFKNETATPVGSFKWRGALNKVLGLTADERASGLVAASAGNHA